MGTSEFAVPILKKLLASKHEVIGVVTQPDRPAGRGQRLRVSPVKQVAEEAGVIVYQPEKVRNEDFVNLIRQISPDLIVVAAYGQIIPPPILQIPRYGCINVHASLLPKYRGAAPVHYALFNGESKTGVTTMLMDAGLDTGPILLQQEVEIYPDDNEGSLEARLAEVGADLLLKTLELVETGSVTPIPQNDSEATYAPLVKREDCVVDWNEDAEKIVNLIRGCTPKPGAFCHWQGSALKIWQAYPIRDETASTSPGEVVYIDKNGITVQTGKGLVCLVEVQPENRNRMHATDFARGYGVKVGTKLE
jgi:methionyl-tRNA formyltransferase